MQISFGLVLDIVIALLLVATIIYAVILNRQLGALRRNKDELSKVIANFNEATIRAESAIPRLKRAAEESKLSLQERIDKAQALRDDLSFMIERGDNMANRLENSVRQARTEGVKIGDKPAPTATPVQPAPQPQAQLKPGGKTLASAISLSTLANIVDDKDDERSDVEKELLRALQAAR